MKVAESAVISTGKMNKEIIKQGYVEDKIK